MKPHFKNLSLSMILSLAMVFSGAHLAWGWTNPSANPPTGTGSGGMTTLNGNIGIGTTGPDSVFHIKSTNVIAPGTVGSESIRIGDDVTVNPKSLFIGVDTSSYIGKGFLQVIREGLDYGDFLINPKGGNVGIGTSAPQHKLSFGAYSTIGVATADGSDTGYAILFGGGGTSGNDRGAMAQFNGNEKATNPGDAFIYAGNMAGGDIRFVTGSGATDSMDILYNGNVGIGTTVPGAKLEIAGVARVNSGTSPTFPSSNAGFELVYDADGYAGSMSGGSGLAFFVSYDRSALAYRDFQLNAANIRFQSQPGDGVGFNINSAGNVGIGVTSPDANYKITTTAGGIKAENNSATQPSGYFSNAGGGPAIQVGTGGFVTEARASDPSTTMVGQIWLRTDL